MILIDVKIYKNGQERQTVRGLSYAQASTLTQILQGHDIKHKSLIWEETQSLIPMKEGEDRNEKTIRLQRVVRG